MAADAGDLGFELIPADDSGLTPRDALDAAAAAALAPDGTPTAAVETVEPTGYSWQFDFTAGRFVRAGTSPARLTGTGVIEQRCLMALNAARYAHPIFSDEFGVEEPQRGIGSTAHEAREAADDWKLAIRDALLVLDEVTDVQLAPEYDPVAGVIWVRDLVVTTVEEVEVSFPDIRLDFGVEG